MKKYSQPSFYHFSEDSIILAKVVADNIDINDKKVLDLCAGCGVVGLELQECSSHKLDLHFLEKQSAFRPYLEDNAGEDAEIFIGELQDYAHKDFDVIVCNPPYFFAGTGRESPNREKQSCRTIVREEFLYILKFIKEVSGQMTKVFFIAREDGVGQVLSLHYQVIWEQGELKIYSNF
jgi:tRNA1Val (adenine37-N6)-methyltransferase